MIAVNINAGLANQMFHYAFGRGLIAKGLDVVFDQTNFQPRKEWSFESVKLQDAFPKIEIKQMPEGHFHLAFPKKTNSKLIKKYRYYAEKILTITRIENYIREKSYGYCDGMEKLSSFNCIYVGFWQSEKYFKHCEDDIRKQFAFLPFDEEKNLKVVEKMQTENSVAIHLRKGKDYLQSELMGKGLCDVKYYQKAIEYIKQRISNPVFYVFTDNPSWVKDNLKSFEYTLVDWNEVSGKRNFRDMQLMSCCKHNIIANSTYSWWGAWLNPNPNKIVIGPDPFFNKISPFFEKQDIICDNWIKM